MDGLAFAGAVRQAELVREREVAPRELVEMYLERISRLDPALNCFRVVRAEQAIAEAEEAARRLGSSRDAAEAPLLGVPVAIKDDADLAGETTTRGSTAHGSPAERDSEAVRRLRAAGAIALGKTNVPELEIFGFTESRAFGVTRNPWDTTRTPGGSSGGSAAAVAAGLCAAATGSDGMGSIRIPAACCGLFGIKPQRGRVSWAPKREGWNGMSAIGPLARRVADAALMLDAMSGSVPGDPPGVPPPPDRSFAAAAASAPSRLRVAVSRKSPPGSSAPLAGEVDAAITHTASVLGELGHAAVDHEVPYGAVALHALVRYLRGIHDDAGAMARPEMLEPRTRGMERLGGAVPGRLFSRVLGDQERMAARVNRVFERFDVVLAPVIANPPFEVERWKGRGALRTLNGSARETPFTGPWNVTGNPACSVPAASSAEGLPIGVQLVGRPGEEATLLALSAQLERELGWDRHRPPVDASGDATERGRDRGAE